MRLRVDFSVASFIAFSLTTLGTSFQVGYFWTVGARFSSFVSFADWLFTSSALYSIILICLPVIAIAPRRLSRLLKASYLIALRTAIFATIALLLMLIISQHTTFLPDEKFWRYALKIYISGSMLLLCIINGFIVLDDFRVGGDVSLNSLLAILVALNIASFAAGTLIADDSQPDDCRITYQNGDVQVGRYLRFLSEAHLIRLGGEVRLVAKDAIREVACTCQAISCKQEAPSNPSRLRP